MMELLHDCCFFFFFWQITVCDQITRFCVEVFSQRSARNKRIMCSNIQKSQRKERISRSQELVEVRPAIINNYSLISKWTVAEYLPSCEAGGGGGYIFCRYSQRLKRIIVLLYTHKVISTTDNLAIFKRKPLKDNYWRLNSCGENMQVAQTMRKTCIYRWFKHGQSS